MSKTPNLCVICAHIDDEIYGMGGSIKKLSTTHNIHVLYICDTSNRHESLNNVKVALDITTIEMLDYVPQQITNTMIGPIADKIREFVLKYDAIGVFTHTQYDISTDHQMVHEATMVACRPIDDMCVDLYAYETCGSSNWVNNTQGLFKPNMYIVLDTEYVAAKVKAIKTEYTDQQRDYPHPRSPESVMIHMRNRGIECQEGTAEAFEIILKKVY